MLARLRRSWDERVAIVGGSMRPTLEPGDWVLVDPEAYLGRAPTVGDLVLVPDPREPARHLVKRVAEIRGGGELFVTGDDADASTDSRAFGSVSATSIVGRPWFRYWPPRRIGRLR